MLPEKYQILDTIGRGGQGTVHKVRNKEDNTIYALKCIDISGCSSKRVQKEIRAEMNSLKTLKHPGVVRLYSTQETKSELYLQMDYIHGMKLTKAVNENALSYDYSIDIMRRLLVAMTYVHKKKVAHLDIKPDNVMLRKDGIPILIDFGCSFTLDTIRKEYKKKGDQFFTPGYVAPEVLMDKNKKFNPKLADIYSLGATFYTMLTQQTVYNAVDEYSHVMSLSNGEQVEPPHIVCKNVPKSISDICMKSIQVNPCERFQSCKEFYTCLNKVSHVDRVKNNQANKKRDKSLYIVRKNLGDKRIGDFGEVFFSKIQEILKYNKYTQVLPIVVSSVLVGVSLGLFGLGVYWGTESQNKVAESIQKKDTNEMLDTKLKRFKQHIDEKKYDDEMDKKSYQEIFNYLLSKAKTGDKDASFYLGKIYDVGYGKEKKIEQAKLWYEKAATLNHVQGMVALGNIYFTGTGGKINYDKALEWYEKALKYKEFSILERLGDIYCTPQKMDYFQAKKYYREALGHKHLGRDILDGHKSISGKLGDLYRVGNGEFQKNYRVAVEWYKRAFKEGDKEILEKMGDIYLTGGYELKANFDQALHWYEEAADEKNKSVLTKIAELYTNEQYGMQNYQQGLEWYNKALENGDTRVLLTIGNLYRDGGPGLESNYQKALDFYDKSYVEGDRGAKQAIEKLYSFVATKPEVVALVFYNYAAKNGHKEVLKYVGDLYNNGTGSFKVDHKKAVSWYERAAEKGDISILLTIGNLYRDGGLGLESDYQKALDFYDKSYEGGDTEAKQAIEELYLFASKKPEEVALIFYNDAIKNGHKEVLKYIGDLYNNGTGSFKVDHKKAVSWYERAVKEGNNEVLGDIASLYTFGSYGLEQNFEKALNWRKRALEEEQIPKRRRGNYYCAMGYIYETGDEYIKINYLEALKCYIEAVKYDDTSEAAMKIAKLYDDNYTGLTDHNKALEWYKQAVKLGNRNAFRKIGNLYFYGGYGIEKDYNEALQWYKQAVAKEYDGSPDAIVGSLYYSGGYGVEKNHNEALKWYEQATEKGNVVVFEILGDLYSEKIGGIVKPPSKEYYEKALKCYNQAFLNGNKMGAVKILELKKRYKNSFKSVK